LFLHQKYRSRVVVVFLVTDPITRLGVFILSTYFSSDEKKIRSRSRRGFQLSIFSGMERELDLLLHEIFDKNPYVRHGIVLKDKDCIVDLGANMGLFSLWCTTQAKDLQIYACEPVPPLFRLATKNLQGIQNNHIHVDPRGVGLEAGQRDFTFFPKATACSTMHETQTIQRMPELYSGTALGLGELWSIHKGAFFAALLCGPFYPLVRPMAIRSVLRRALSAAQRYPCEIVSLSDLIEEWNLSTIDLLKIDVQGAEVDILLGIQDQHWQCIRSIALEVNTFLGRSGETDIEDMLRQRGYKVIRDESPEIAAPGTYFVYALREH
jgi:hypothetical protein